MKNLLFSVIIDRIQWEIRSGKTPIEAVNIVASEKGLSKDGKVYAYMIDRFCKEV